MNNLARMTQRQAAQENLRYVRRLNRQIPNQAARVELKPLDFNDRSANELRPRTFDEMVGQDHLKALMGRLVSGAKQSGRPLDHMLLIGSSGTGKSTLAQVVACELERRVFQLKAPVAQDVFKELAHVARDGDVVIVDEVHMQCSGDRRGITQAADPECYYSIMEDRRLMTRSGVMPFPAITIVGCTTDAGLLPEPFINRFPLRPHLDEYAEADMVKLAKGNAHALGLGILDAACEIFANASRCNPRQLNTYIRNARSLTNGVITDDVAREVVVDLNSCTLDGLTMPMQMMLSFLLKCEREVKGVKVYRASVNTIATAIGFARDTKAVALFTEPWLIKCGYVSVGPQGRELTKAGVRRADEL